MRDILRIITGSIKFYRKAVLYQVLIMILLTAIITGSLLVGTSVKESIKRSGLERLGNTGIIVSSGTRYFDQNLARRINDRAKIPCTGLLEIKGSCQLLNSQRAAFNTQIYGIKKDFFHFQSGDSAGIKPGEIAVNKRLGEYLGIKAGDDLIIRFNEISDIPADAPFAPSGEGGKSVVMKVGVVLGPNQAGNFSLSISQVTPMNIFMNLEDLEANSDDILKINRLLFLRNDKNTLSSISEVLKHYLRPADIGLKLRFIKKTDESEISSDRIFIDSSVLNEINTLVPNSSPVITYLANRFISGNKSTPYSFVSALPSRLYPEIGSGNEMIINRWLANDLSAKENDTIKMFWFSPDSLNNLVEKNGEFIVKRIVEMNGIWGDSLLMPDFPGISGKESCSDWDAGVPVKMHDIRPKDEDYWNNYRGTPKAFINYEKGKELWGNNFGPATAVRYGKEVNVSQIEENLAGSVDPFKSGFIISDLSEDALKAADESIDFGTLFLSLGIFLIVASFVLLSFSVSAYFDSKRKHISTFYALGFTKKWITRLLITEAALISLAACLIGSFGGYIVNILITSALNTVWSGAVQTNTLNHYFSFAPVITGFIVTFLTILVLIFIKIKRFLRGLTRSEKLIYKTPSGTLNLILVLVSALATLSLFIFSLLSTDQKLSLSFAAGSLFLVTLVFSWKQYYLRRNYRSRKGKIISRRYYSFNPSHAITPILFIAAGVFTVFILAANKMNFAEKSGSRSGGTGGYLLWCENTIAIREDLNNELAKKSFGLDDDALAGIRFVLMKRSSGNDASCLNLNHITAPPLLGVDPSDFIRNKSFSFSRVLGSAGEMNPWQYLQKPSESNTIYGIADQTVLEWGLKLRPGDTLILRAENGAPLNIIIAAGLQSSIFQGNVLIGKENFSKFYPSVSGSSVMLVDGNSSQTAMIKTTLNERLENYGVNVEETSIRLASFNAVTNTYLSVFVLFGALGMIIGIAGLGFVLLRNYNQRKQEFALMLAIGFSEGKIRRMILSEQLLILFAGVSSGIVSAVTATLPSIRNNIELPWASMLLMILAISVTGITVLIVSVRSVTNMSLTSALKKE